MMAELGIVVCLLDYAEEEWAAMETPDVAPSVASPPRADDDTAREA